MFPHFLTIAERGVGLSMAAATEYRNCAIRHPVFCAQKRRKAQKSSDFWASGTYRLCIKDRNLIEPAMGSAAFLNEAINQLAEAYISLKEKETGEIIGYEDRLYCPIYESRYKMLCN